MAFNNNAMAEEYMQKAQRARAKGHPEMAALFERKAREYEEYGMGDIRDAIANDEANYEAKRNRELAKQGKIYPNNPNKTYNQQQPAETPAQQVDQYQQPNAYGGVETATPTQNVVQQEAPAVPVQPAAPSQPTVPVQPANPQIPAGDDFYYDLDTAARPDNVISQTGNDTISAWDPRKTSDASKNVYPGMNTSTLDLPFDIPPEMSRDGAGSGIGNFLPKKKGYLNDEEDYNTLLQILGNYNRQA